jgi:C-terminal processing protease CtpA/Prc
MRSEHNRVILSLILLICVSSYHCAAQNTLAAKPGYKSFSIEINNNESSENDVIRNALWEFIKDRLIQKGYVYKKNNRYPDLKTFVQYYINPPEDHYLKLDVNLNIYETKTGKVIWSASISKKVQHKDISNDLIRPMVDQLTYRLPFAPDMGGVGVIISRDLKIRGFSPVSPAEKAGLKVNDTIIMVDNKEVDELDECTDMLRGKANTWVNLCVRRGEEELKFLLSRIPLNKMEEKNVSFDDASRKNLPQEFRRRIFEQP